MSRAAFVASLAALGVTTALAADAAPTCPAWQIDYTLAAMLYLSDTPMGAGDGAYNIGPGSMRLRFSDVGGKPGGKAQMLAYQMRDHFTVETHTLFWTTKVVTRAQTRATPDSSGVVARGALASNTLKWASKVRGYRTDGTLTCEGSLCGKFGAPPAGTSELHVGPNDVQFSSLTFSSDLKRLEMPRTFVSKTKMPKQTAHVMLKGRETARRKVELPSCL